MGFVGRTDKGFKRFYSIIDIILIEHKTWLSTFKQSFKKKDIFWLKKNISQIKIINIK